LVPQHSPELLFCSDKRGFTPLDYIPQDSTPAAWCHFLENHRAWLRLDIQYISYALARDELQLTLERASAIIITKNNYCHSAKTSQQEIYQS
jgi:hypothetical protein